MNICVKHLMFKHLNNFSYIFCQKRLLSAINERTEKQMKRFDKTKREEMTSFDSRYSDSFGTFGSEDDYRFNRLRSESLKEDDDNYDKLEIKRGPKMAEIGYKKQLNKLINRKPIQMRKALELYNEMVSEDRIPPHKCTYSLLINGCAKVGLTSKAFELFEELLKYDMRPTKQTITSLLNACAECPFPEFGLEKARYLRQWMALEGFVANTFHYNSMIKAFGKLGDIETAFDLVNEMVSKGQTTDEHTFCMLLMSSISNKESGLFYAIQVFRRMIFHKIPLNVHTFNLLLKAIKECGIGSEDNVNSIVSKTFSQFNNFNEVNNKSELKTFDSEVNTNNSSIKTMEESLPSIPRNHNFVLKPNQKNLIEIDFKLMSNPCNRLMLFGGIEGFIKMMIDSNVIPNIKTLTLLVESIDLSDKSVKQMIQLLDEFKIKADADFFNILIKHLSLKKNLISAKNILQIMSKRGLQPNIMTFGVLALGCNRFVFGKQLLEDMDKINIKPNVQIMGALITNSCHKIDFLYINHLIDYMKDNDIKPDNKIIEMLEIVKIKFQKLITSYEWNGNSIPQRYHNNQFRQTFHLFKTKFEDLLKTGTIEEESHPWSQYQFQELPNKKKMHSFVKYMKQKTAKRRAESEEKVIDEFSEDELYDT